MFRGFFLTAAAAVSLSLVVTATSQAQFTLYLQDGTDQATVTIAGSTVTESVTGGTPTFSYGFAGATSTFLAVQGLQFDSYNISGTIASSDWSGNASFAQLNIQSLTITNSGPSSSTLSLGIGEGGFLAPVGKTYLQSEVVGTFSQGTGATITGSTAYNYPTGVATSTQTINSGFADKTNTSSGFTASSNFSLTDTITVTGITGTQNVGVTLYGEIYAAPAPPGLILAATMVPFIGLFRRRLKLMAMQTQAAA